MANRKLRALIVDDEPVARQVLREELAEFPGVALVGEAENGPRAVQQIRELRPDLVLLDVQMPGMDGFEVVRRLEGPLPPAIIFVTAYDEYALKAFDVGAIDYLLKPVAQDRLQAAIDRAQNYARNPRHAAEGMARLLNARAADRPAAPRKVIGRKGKEYFLLNLDEILAFQAEGDIVWVITARQRYMATLTLQALEERLKDTPFRRVSRGALVNIDQIRKMTSLSSQRWMLTLTSGMQLTVSKRQANLVRDMLP